MDCSRGDFPCERRKKSGTPASGLPRQGFLLIVWVVIGVVTTTRVWVGEWSHCRGLIGGGGLNSTTYGLFGCRALCKSACFELVFHQTDTITPHPGPAGADWRRRRSSSPRSRGISLIKPQGFGDADSHAARGYRVYSTLLDDGAWSLATGRSTRKKSGGSPSAVQGASP